MSVVFHGDEEVGSSSGGGPSPVDSGSVAIELQPSGGLLKSPANLTSPSSVRRRSLMSKTSRQPSLRKNKLTESWPGSHHIRRLFRLFDTDNSGSISPAEFRAGLASLGFDVSDVASLHTLQASIDVGRSGDISESEFIKAFRTLNRKAIEAKLAGGASGSQSSLKGANGVPVKIQLVKLGSELDESDAVSGQFSQMKNIHPSQLSEILAREEETFANGSDKSVRWIDVTGLHAPVLALLSNFYLLPHEMLGEEIEIESTSHAEFFTGVHQPDAPQESHLNKKKKPLAVQHASSERPLQGLSAGAEAGDAAASSSSGIAPLNRTASMGDLASAATRNATMKLLVHSLRLENPPLYPADGGEGLKLVTRRQYKASKPRLADIPVHIIVANEHTLITVRPFVAPRATPAGDLRAKENAQAEADDLNDLFGDFISTLSQETDSTSFSSVLSINSAKLLLVKVFEDIIDENWALRDSFKEWKIYLSEHQTEMSDEYFLLLTNDLEAMAASSVRFFKPLLAMVANLCGESHVPTTGSEGSNSAWRASMAAAAQSTQHTLSHAIRMEYLREIHPQLRQLHRAVARQSEQAALTLTLARALQEAYTQRGRDAGNDTLYMLTVVTTIITPLQVMSSIYGMNFDVLPELHYENAYTYFWIINLVVIFLIALGFRFKSFMQYAREQYF